VDLSLDAPAEAVTAFAAADPPKDGDHEQFANGASAPKAIK
jgi:hypothetical protein